MEKPKIRPSYRQEKRPRRELSLGASLRLRRIVRLYVPVVLGLVISQVAVVIDRNLASRTGDQTVAWMDAATTLIQFPLGLVMTAISMAVLPSLARFDAEADLARFRQTLALGLRMVLTLILPATAGLLILGEPIVASLFQHGVFSGTTITTDPLSLTAITDSAGHYTVADAPAGVYTLTADHPSHLFARRADVVVEAGRTTTLPDVTILAGDVNSDGRIGIQDAVIVSRNFGQDVPPADRLADLNCDARVNIQDAVLLSRNFDRNGPGP